MISWLELSACIIAVWAVVGYVVSLVLKRGDVADVFWGWGFIAIGAGGYWARYDLAGYPGLRATGVLAMTAIWGLRLSAHIFWRNHGKPEDFRYANWRKEWGKNFFWRSFLQIWVLQGVLLFLVSLPVAYGAREAGPGCTWLAGVGVFIWAFGLIFEAVGDYQLERFRATRTAPGKVIETGLWRYTRHPNYFGEVTLWWGLYLVTASGPGGWITFAGPLTISVLILKISGIPMLEKKYENNAAFQAYAARTSVFFPWFPSIAKPASKGA